MENTQSKSINGAVFTARTTPSTVCKLSDLTKYVPYIIKFKNDRPTRFNSYIVTITNEDTGEECNVYMPEYIAKSALSGERFIYNGLQEKSDGSGHRFHSVLWA